MDVRGSAWVAIRFRLLAILSVVTLALIAAYAQTSVASAHYRPGPTGPDRLVTNEVAHWNPDDPQARRSPDWDVTSGSLYVRDSVGWTGRPDDSAAPNPGSTNGTGSSVFRMSTWRHDFAAVTVTLRV